MSCPNGERVMTTKTNISLANICRQLKIDPKAGRAKFRRLEVPVKLLADKESWTFKASARSWVVEQLKADHRKS